MGLEKLTNRLWAPMKHVKYYAGGGGKRWNRFVGEFMQKSLLKDVISKLSGNKERASGNEVDRWHLND